MVQSLTRKQIHSRLIDGLALFCLILAAYLFSFKGVFTSIDELALYARTESLVQHGNIEAPQLYFAAIHNPVGRQEIGFPLLAAPFYWAANQVAWVNGIHAVMLLNPIVTALTAVFLYVTTYHLGYGRTAALLAAFAFGFTSLAWPYAQTFYREPVVALAWSIGLYGLVRWYTDGSFYWVGFSLIVLILAVFVKATAFIAIPCLTLPFIASRLPRRQIVIALPFILGGALMLFFLVAALRYGSADSVLRRIGDQDIVLILQRIYGQLLSPGKGLVFYMPATLVAVAGLFFMWSRRRATAVAIALTALALTVAYATYGVWYGGQSWGPRFLTPMLPLLMLGVAPAWEAAQKANRARLTQISLGALLAFSLVVQLGVVTADWWPGYDPLFNAAPDPENSIGLNPTRLDLSPPLVQLAVWRPEFLNLVWLYYDADVGVVILNRLAVLLVVGVSGAAICWWGAVNRRWPLPLLVLPVLIALLALLRGGATANFDSGGITVAEGREIAVWISEVPTQPYTMVTISNNFTNHFYLGYLKGKFRHYWYSPAQQAGFVITADTAEWVSLAVDRVHMAPEYSGKEIEWWLNDHFYRVDSKWIGHYELIRYANFPQAAWLEQPVALRFGDGFAIERAKLSALSLPPGHALGVTLNIERVGDLPEYHQLFVHLMKSDGSLLLNGLDGPVKYGYSLAVPWEMGHVYEENRGIYIPLDAPPGSYDLIVGFYAPAGPLAAAPPANPEATYAILTQIIVTADGP